VSIHASLRPPVGMDREVVMARGWLVVVVMAVLGCGREGAV